MNASIRNILVAISAAGQQFILLAFIGLLYLLAALGVLPAPDELADTVQAMFERYGLPAVFLISFLENLVGLNAYFPGSIAILGAMTLSAGEPKLAILTFLAIVVPSFVAHQLNFRLGLRNQKPDMAEGARPLLVWYFSTFWHPHFTAVTCVASGRLGLRYFQFLSYFIVPFLAWNAFWGISMYVWGGKSGGGGQALSSLMVVYLIIWAVWDIVRDWKARREENAVP